ncbi:MAG: hypothetical protein ACJ75B_00660 [Flavisolibacter sp.]
MPVDPIRQQPQENENVESNENNERFESDTQKIIHRHLENKDDVITEEDIRNVRVGQTPPVFDSPTEARFEDEEQKDEVEREFIDTGADEDEEDENEHRITPWDTIDPKED